jgi:hypothetical protein
MPTDLFAKYGINPNSANDSGAPVDLFQKYNINPNPSTWDLISSALRNLATQTGQAAKQVVTHPLRAIENVGAGAGEGLESLANLPHTLAAQPTSELSNILTGGVTGLASQVAGKPALQAAGEQLASKIPTVPNLGIEQAMGLNNVQPGDPLLRGIGSYLPFGAIGGEAGGLEGTLSRSGAAGLYGAANQQNPLAMALSSAGLEGLGGMVGKGISALTSPKEALLNTATSLLKTNLPADELKQNLALTQGTQTGLGNVMGSPYLKKFQENILPNIPFSGASNTMQTNAQNVINQGENLVNNIVANKPPEDLGQNLQDALIKAANKAQLQKRENYKNVENLASQSGLQVGRDNLSGVAKDYLDNINENPELSRLMPQNVKNDLQFYAKNITPTESSSTLKNSNILRGKLGDEANNNFTNGNLYEYNIYRDLKNGLDQDIQNSINNSDNPEIKSAYNNAQNFYQTQIAPFELPQIVKYTRQGGDPDTILNTFLKTGRKSDRANLLNSLMSKLPESDKNLVPYAYYSNAYDKDGNFNPNTFQSLHNALGNRQKNVLVPDEDVRNQLNNYSKLVQLNQKPLYLMANPPTGQQNVQPLISGSLGAAAMAGHIPGVLSAIGSAKLANKLLTSENLRNALVNQMLKNQLAKEVTKSALSSTIARNLPRAVIPLSVQQQQGQS